MPKTHLPFAKIVATPTPISWSQAYGAGGLFVAFSLITEKPEHEETLGALGKKILNDLEAEFFTLEEKSLLKIKDAITSAFSQIPEGVLISASIAFVKDDILYGFLVGSGTILLRRGAKLGQILSENGRATKEIQAASGRLVNDDLVILETLEFKSLIGESLGASLESNNIEDIAETLSPLVHGKEEGAASAILFTYSPQPETAPEDEQEIAPLPEPAVTTPEPAAEKEEAPQQPFADRQESFPHPSGASDKSPRQLPSFAPLFHRFKQLNHRQRLLVSIAGLLVLVLLVSIIFTTSNAQSMKSKEAFTAAYAPALQHFEEGKGLIGLNTPLAREELEKAQAAITKAEKEISPNSEEGKKLAALKKDISMALEETSGAKQASVSPAADGASKLLSALTSGDRLYAAQDEDAVYFLTTKEIGGIQRSSNDTEVIIENDSDWTKPAGLGTFLGNFYVLDKSAGILKFVEGSDGFGKSSYLTGEKPDLAKAVHLAIDSSIYVLFSNGDILKFTKGAPDTFTLSGLDTPLKSPTRIYTTPDLSALYVLDNGNGRIVKLSKEGAYQEQYQADALKKAQDFEIDEANKKVYFLRESQLLSISL